MKFRENYVAFRTIVDKDIKRILRIWVQTLLPSAITMTLYFVIFGQFIGSQVRSIEGFSYMEFIVPGIVMMAIITNSFMNVVSSFFFIKFQRSIEEILVSPTPNWVILTGYITGGVFRGLLVGIIVLIISLFFTSLQIHSLTIIITFILLTAIVFSLGGFLNALYAKKIDQINIIPVFVLTPLTYLGGVFYSIKMLPEFWQGLSLLNPILYMVNGFRFGFLGISDINVWIGFWMLILLTVVLFYINLHLLKTGIGIKQ